MIHTSIISSKITILGAFAVGYFLGSSSFTNSTITISFLSTLLLAVVSVLASREINAQKRKSLIDEHANRDETMDRKAFGISTTDENDDDEIAFHLERCEWMNGFLKDLWPYIAKYSDNLLRTDIQNTVRQMEPVKVFKNFEFTDVNLGFVPPRIEKIATYRRKCGKTNAVIIEAHINFCSNLNIGMKVMKLG